jgi:hypothetical protein
MKKIVFLSAMIFGISLSCAIAQSALPAGKPVKTGNEWKMPGDALERSKNFSDSLKSALSLNDETTKKVFNAYLANTKSVDEIAVMYKTEAERKSALKENRNKFDLALKDVLSSREFKNYMAGHIKNR